jgi:hypothetical protein
MLEKQKGVWKYACVVTDQEARITFVLGFIIPLDNPTTNLSKEVRMLEKKETTLI